MVAQLEQTHRVLQFDPQGHRMGPLGTLATQIAVVWGLMWTMGVLRELLLRPFLGAAALALVLGSLLLAPRRVVMEFPISLSLLGILAIAVGSVMWTVDSAATTASLRSLFPAMLALIIASGLLTLKDLTDALLWAIRITLVITVGALILIPSTRLHVGVQSGGVEDYAGWHGLFNHKNNMSEFLVLAIPTVLVFHRNGLVKWGTLGVIGVLLVGSTSATGLSAGVFVVAAWVWLQIYHSQWKEDRRNSTLLFLSSIVGGLAGVAVAAASFATITSAYGKDSTLSGRTLIWEASIDALMRQPFLGHGYGALFFREGISSETAEIWRQVGFDASHAHNGLLDLALQVGFIGVGIFLVFWLSIAWRAWGIIGLQPDLGIWVICVLSANVLMSLSEDVFFSGGWLAMFCVMKTLLMRREESLRRPGWLERPIDKWAFR